MENKIYKLIMKYPIPSIIGSLAMFVPFYVAILYFHVHKIHTLGGFGIIISSVIFHSTVVFLWWLISYLSNDLMFRALNKKTPLDNNFQTKKWQTNIVVGSLFSLIIAFLSLLLCYVFNWEFKVFLILVYAIPFLRIFILFIEYIYFKLTNKI
ncbi:hypothetical protein CRYO30217_02895 [Parvicella tangerina]|uniref:Uncharacterized protein n=1 Tax=Parvicella tangerina TaxID=2829795 RepID=A0A916JRC1_9FLAO|nr:hypothetical protein CRYO30217_02895 [Parvicella tangerina]